MGWGLLIIETYEKRIGVLEYMIWCSKKWEKFNSRVEIIQSRLYKLSQSKNKESLFFLQTKIIHDGESKYFSMAQVFLNIKWKGINFRCRKIYFTLMDKMGLIRNLNIGSGWSKKITRSISKKYRLRGLQQSVFTIIREIIKQKIVLLAIEPEWEVKFESNSYGYRKWCNIHSAIKVIFNELKKVTKNAYTLNIHLLDYIEKVDHTYLLRKLKTIPQITKQIKVWLKNGLLKKVKMLGKKKNTTVENQINKNLGGILPFLINVIFHGIEIDLKNWMFLNYKLNLCKKQVIKKYSIIIVRYLSSLIIIHTNLITLNKINIFLKYWVIQNLIIKSYLWITNFTKLSDGFEFVGYRFIKILKRGIVKVYPTKKSQKHLIYLIGEKCKKFRGLSIFHLLDFLKVKMLGWASFFRYVRYKKLLKKLDYVVYLLLKFWLFKSNRQLGRKVLIKKYLGSKKIYIFYGKPYMARCLFYDILKKDNGSLTEYWNPRLSWVKSIYYINTKNKTAVHNSENYWHNLTKKYSVFKYWQQKILKMQI